MHLTVVVPTYKRREKRDACIASVSKQTYKDFDLIVYEDHEREFAFGIWNRFAPTVARGGGLVYICDDVELDPWCLEAAVDSMQSKWDDTNGLVGFHQRNIHGLKGTCRAAMGMIGWRFMQRFHRRKPFCPDYRRFHADLELGLLGVKVRRFEHCHDASLVHYHPFHYAELEDETHRIVRDPIEVEEDHRVRRLRKSKGLLWGTGTNRLVGRRTP